MLLLFLTDRCRGGGIYSRDCPGRMFEPPGSFITTTVHCCPPSPRPGTDGGWVPPTLRKKREGGRGHPPPPEMGYPPFLQGKLRLVLMDSPAEGILPGDLFSAWQRAGPGQRGEGVPPACPGSWVGGDPILRKKEGGGWGPPPPPHIAIPVLFKKGFESPRPTEYAYFS